MLKEILYDFCGYNISIFYYFNTLGNIGVMPYMLSILSDFFRIWSFGLYYLILCCYQYYYINHIDNSIRREQIYYDSFYEFTLVGMCYACFGFIYAMLKFSINLPRPYCSLPEGSFMTISNIETVRCLSSFPSAHTGLALLIVISIWNHMNNLCRILSLCIVAFVAWSRITLAMHYPADILYSLIVTIVSVTISHFIFNIFRNNVVRYCADKAKKIFIKKFI